MLTIPESCLTSIFISISAHNLFIETAGSWLSSQYAVDVYTSYLTLLVESKKAALLVNSIRDWDQFEQQVRDELLIRLLSTQTPVLTANLLHAVEILKVEVFMNVVPIHDSSKCCMKLCYNCTYIWIKPLFIMILIHI